MFPYYLPNYYYPNFSFYSTPINSNNNNVPQQNYPMPYSNFYPQFPPMPPMSTMPPPMPPVVMGYQPPTHVQNSYPVIPNQVSIDPTPYNNNQYSTPQRRLNLESPPQLERKKPRIEGGQQELPPVVVVEQPPPNTQQQSRFTPQEENDIKEASKILEEHPQRLLHMEMGRRRYYLELIEKSDKEYSRTYAMNFKDDPHGKDPYQVIDDICKPESDLITAIREFVMQHKYIKCTVSFRSGFIGSDDTEYINDNNIDKVKVWKFFECEPIVITESENRYIPDMLKDRILKSIGPLFQTERSSLKFRRIGDVQVQLAKSCAIAGSGGGGYTDIPQWLKNKKCIVSIDNDKNNDQLCFLYAVAANFFHDDNGNNKHLNRVEKYKEYVKQNFDFSMLLFPVDPLKHSNKIHIFEQRNEITINIFKIHHGYDTSEVVPIYITSIDKMNRYPHINLLYHDNHFWLVTKLHVLLRPTNKKCKNPYPRCNYCFEVLSTEQKAIAHEDFNCQQHKGIIRTFPPPNTSIYFKNIKYQQLIPITIYWDTEVYQEPVTDPE